MTEQEAVTILSEFADYLDQQIVGPATAELSLAIRTTTRPKHGWEMLGQYLRDAAVLVLIFVPIDLLIPQLRTNQPVDRKWLIEVVVTLAVSGVLLSCGMWAERREK